MNGEKRGPNEFVDTRKIPISRKFVKSISQQEPTESRRLWKEVTEVKNEHAVGYCLNTRLEFENQRHRKSDNWKASSGAEAA